MAARMLSGVAPSWSRRSRLHTAQFLRACRLEGGGGELPVLPKAFRWEQVAVMVLARSATGMGSTVTVPVSVGEK